MKIKGRAGCTFLMRYAKDENEALDTAREHRRQRNESSTAKRLATLARHKAEAMGPPLKNTFRKGTVTLAGTDWGAKCPS